MILLIFGFLLFYSCSKDIDILTDAILNDPIANIEERKQAEEEEQAGEEEADPEPESQPEETPEEEPVPEETEGAIEDGFESRTTTFGPAEDAYVQSGKGYNQQIIRLDEDNRTSYLLFDLSPIDEIGGYVTDATLEFTINGDEGSGTINVYKGISSEWTETNLVEGTAPDIDIILGNLIKEYKIGSTEEIPLSASDLLPEETTLILEHEQGNDLAIASKEHPSKIGPKLIVTYNAPEDAEAIVIVEEEPAPAAEEEPSTGEEGTIEGDPAENNPPISIADASPSSGGAPLTVSFTGSNSSDDNDITGYSWNFKDGATSTSSNPSHTFSEVGSYEVTLTVTDAEGLNDTDTVTITVNAEDNEAPVAKASATPLSGEAPLQVSFTGSNSTDDNGVAGYSWNFKDGGTSSNANPGHTFSDAGTYAVELTVTDENGLTDKASVTINVTEPQPENEAPVAVAGASPLSGDAPLQVQFSSSSSSDDKGITSHLWNFTPNDASGQANPSRTFDNAGVYEVTLTVTDEEGLTDTDTVTITVNAVSSGGGGGNIPPGAVLASSFGFNSSNATDAFKSAILSNNSTIVIDKQSSDWIVEPITFFSLSHKTIIFEPGVVLRAKAGAFPSVSDQLLHFSGGNDVVLEGYGATLRMNKSEYTSGEWRHTIGLVNTRNFEIRGFTIRDSGGDGIILSGSPSGTYNENITIEDVVCENHRRIGMSIISAQNVWVRNSEFRGSSGTRPETGVQLEPDSALDRLVNINFINCEFKNNNSNGFHVSLHKMNSSSIPISVTVKDSEFAYNSVSSSNPKPKAEIYLDPGNTSSNIGGQVLFERVTISGSNRMGIFIKKSADTYRAIFRDCIAKNVAKNGTVPIAMEAGTGTTLGGVEFDNFYLEYNTDQPFLRVAAPSTHTLKNITGTFTVKEPYDNPPEFTGSHNSSQNVNVNISYQHIN